MITNIIDHRSQPYRWKSVDAIVEPTWHDNSCKEADQAEHEDRGPAYAARTAVAVSDAVAWASEFDVPLTLYLYDPGSSGAGDDILG